MQCCLGTCSEATPASICVWANRQLGMSVAALRQISGHWAESRLAQGVRWACCVSTDGFAATLQIHEVTDADFMLWHGANLAMRKANGARGEGEGRPRDEIPRDWGERARWLVGTV